MVVVVVVIIVVTEVRVVCGSSSCSHSSGHRSQSSMW